MSEICILAGQYPKDPVAHTFVCEEAIPNGDAQTTKTSMEISLTCQPDRFEPADKVRKRVPETSRHKRKSWGPINWWEKR